MHLRGAGDITTAMPQIKDHRNIIKRENLVKIKTHPISVTVTNAVHSRHKLKSNYLVYCLVKDPEFIQACQTVTAFSRLLKVS
jgi:hypothetical protein